MLNEWRLQFAAVYWEPALLLPWLPSHAGFTATTRDTLREYLGLRAGA